MSKQYCYGCGKNLGEYEEDTPEDARHCLKCLEEFRVKSEEEAK